jgi:UDP-glucose 4-epimerase
MKTRENAALHNLYLITGGAGFIGVNVVRALIPVARGIRVLDDLSSGRAEDLKDLPVDFRVGDIRDPRVVEEMSAGVEVMIHLAAHTGVVPSVADPGHDMSVNVAGTLNLLSAAVRQGVKRFVFASTGGAIVGDVAPPVHETMPPQPLSPYGASKLAGEGYCSAFWGSYGLPTVPLRFSNIYGPYSYHKGSVIAKFFREILAQEPLTIFGDGEQTRDFLYVTDLCQAILTAVHREMAFGQPIQLGTGRETSINHLVKLMKEVVGEDHFPLVKYAPVRAGEVHRNFVALDRARKHLHFAPPTELSQGLQETWEWFQAQSRG